MKGTVFMRLLVHLTITVVLITLLVGTLMYRYTSRVLKEEVLGSNIELLAQTKKIVEQALGEVQQMASSLALDADVQKAVWLAWNLEDDYRFLVNTSNLFSARINSSNYIHSIYLYSSTNQKLISSSGIYDKADFPYTGGLQRFLEIQSSSSWEAESQPSTAGSGDVISFYFSVPIRNAQKKGVLLINLKEDVLYNAVVNTNQRKLGNVAILSPEGQVLSYRDKKSLLTRFDASDIQRIRDQKEGYFVKEIGGVRNMVSFKTSTLNGWIYVTLNPYDEVFKQSKEVVRFTFIISLIGLLLGILLMMLVSRTYYKPIKRMVQHIVSNLEKPLNDIKYRDEFGFIRESFTQLVNENEEFKATFHEQELILQDHMLVNLLSGKADDGEDMLRQLEYYGLNLDPEHFIVMVIRIHLTDAWMPETETEEQMRNLIHFRIRTICEETMARYTKGVYVSQFHRHDVIILNAGQWIGNDLAFDKTKELALQLKTAVTGQLKDVLLTFGIGGKYRKLSEIFLAYNEAVEALFYEQIAGKGSVLSLHDMQVNQSNRNRFIAYRGLVDKMIGELKTGNLEKALKTKDHIIGQLENDADVGFSYKHMILAYLLNGLVAVRVELVRKDDEPDQEERHWYADFPKLQNMEGIRCWLGSVLEQLSEELHDKRINKNVEVIEKLVAYIREHFRESIGLTTIADLVFMNSHYLSKVFKEVTGQTFTECLTEIRLEEACRLLAQTNKSVIEIAELTGFGQKQNVIRTFKKYTGLTPSEYRNRHLLGRLTDENGKNDSNPIN
ncbi:helix-turn-helix domain-containing protein [Paenibacillus dokdonensis]|uniref:helix-turn-helix domain-containing protein n=1 Tax=Paenibacillus dokdonensis TaxID=2567944 RepID=UPI001457997C|nr:helix-turn-helix domain-containing protein [Paenibacillus dokdonensis]